MLVCSTVEGAPLSSDVDSPVPGNELTSMRSISLEVMAALPLDGSLGLSPEEDYRYADQPWNRPYLFGMSCGTLAKPALGYCRLVYVDLKRGRLHSRVGVAYGVPHSASLLSLPPHHVQIPPTSPPSAGSLIRGVGGGAKL